METSELIQQVKLRPAIWSPTNRDNKKMAAAWQQICKLAWPEFVKLTLDEKRAKCLKLQKTWKGLTQSFIRDHNRQKQRNGRLVQKSQYYYQLSFLAPTIDIMCSTPGSSNGPGIAAPSTLDVTPALVSPGPSTSGTQTHQERDAEEDRHFMLSLVSFVQDVPRSSKLALRSEIMEVIAKYTGGKCSPGHVSAVSQEY